MSRFIHAALVGILSLPAVSQAQSAPSPEEKVRKAIDDICGDTWCEGDYQYSFRKVSFDSKTNQTTVDFFMTPYLSEEPIADEATFASTLVSPSFAVRCVVKGYSDAKLILTQQGDLNWDFYTAFGDCVNSLEKNLVK